MAILRFIPEVIWYAGIWTTPFDRLQYDTVLECFNCSTRNPVVIPKLRNRVYLSAKALLHLMIQRRCISHGSDKAVFKPTPSQHPIMWFKHYEGDLDLESSLVSSIVSWQLQNHVLRDFSVIIPAMAYASGPIIIEALKQFNLTEPLCSCGICYVYQNDQPFKLCKVTLFSPVTDGSIPLI